MKLASPQDRSPLAGLRSALTTIGFRTHKEYDELSHIEGCCDIRISLRPVDAGHLVRCSISVDEEALGVGGLELFNELSLAGYPATAYGAGRGRVSYGFEWLHIDHDDWQNPSLEIEGLFQLICQFVRPASRPTKIFARCSEDVTEGVLAVATAA